MNKNFRGRCRCALALATAVVLAGCHTTTVDPNAGARAQVAFDEQLGMAAQAINVGDLHSARDFVREARAAATTARDHQKVESLDHLISGAEALRTGDPDGARAEWSRIEEPRLAREVRHKARMIGVDVPMEPVEEGATR